MKDAKAAKVVGELPNSCDPAVSEWGNPPAIGGNPTRNSRGRTRGTEISKYPEEKKSNEIPLVSDERTGKSLNPDLSGGCRTLTSDNSS